MDWIVTGGSRGLGRALALALARRAGAGDRLFALARDAALLGALARDAGGLPAELITPRVDLAQLHDARRVGEALAAQVRDAILVHNAGLWPTRRVLVDGIEAAFATNCLGPLAFQQPLLASKRVSRVLVVSAGLLVKGRFDLARTPTGADFSAIRTYCTTKLAGAAAMRDEARRHPEVDFALVHPGVIRTDLGAMSGPLGWLLSFAKRGWDAPEVGAARLLQLLGRERWQHCPGEAPWFFEGSEQPWPAEVDRASADVAAAVARYLPS